MSKEVESFAFDHRTARAPNVRVVSVSVGDLPICKYDLRFIKPNTGAMDTDGLHSLEHLLASEMRARRPLIIDISPMGCRTGFYLCEVGAPDKVGVEATLINSLTAITFATDVPAANEVQCGNWRDHNLAKAQRYAQAFIDGK